VFITGWEDEEEDDELLDEPPPTIATIGDVNEFRKDSIIIYINGDII